MSRERIYNRTAIRARFGNPSRATFNRHIMPLLPKPDLVIGSIDYWVESSLKGVEEQFRQRARDLYGTEPEVGVEREEEAAK